MEDVAGHHRAAGADIELKHEMSRRVTGRRQNLDEFVEAVRPGDKIGAARFDDRQHAFAKRAEFRRRGGGIAIDRLKIIKIRL